LLLFFSFDGIYIPTLYSIRSSPALERLEAHESQMKNIALRLDFKELNCNHANTAISENPPHFPSCCFGDKQHYQH
jgi:hypothetical protein